MSENALETDLLDLLVDGPSHVRGLHAGIIRHVRFPVPTHLSAVIEAVRKLHDGGFVTLYMERSGGLEPVDAGQREHALLRYGALFDTEPCDDDEVGLWCEITEPGRDLWREAGYSQELEGVRWTLDHSGDSLTIRAETHDAATRVLDWWLEQSDEWRRDGPATVREIPEFSLRDGTVVHGGAELTMRCVRRAGGTGR